nr:MAG TPA: hypothetical protein [Caudoviricetes sp.]DAN25159.1 MAG TPA: hypothetical protein [Caudoviricetes sp.]
MLIYNGFIGYRLYNVVWLDVVILCVVYVVLC